MTVFDRELTGFRYAETVHADTLQAIAARELGDAARWPELAAINGLVPPYITDDPALASAKVLRSGALILVPAATATASAATNPNLVFGVDCALTNKRLTAANGDIAVVAGVANLRQAIKHRIETQDGEILFHPEYGCKVGRLLGQVNGPNKSLLGGKYVRDALAQDDRVQEVTGVIVTVTGDTTRIDAEVRPVVGKAIDVAATA